MKNNNFKNQTLEEKIEELYVVLNNLQTNQQNEIEIIKNNHATNMKKLSKLQEYNQISDMTNQIFELRISGIEQAIKQLNSLLLSQKE